GQLYNVTNVLDVYVFNGLTQTADIGMAAAAGLYQSVVGLILVILSNLLARRVDPNSALF
ncbi:sugar ABC transporter permease, partial [Stenotrophomonas acidaminiphila]|nr:sugar ABC transporter permease [Stenotrophomonas acidaminiphila]